MTTLEPDLLGIEEAISTTSYKAHGVKIKLQAEMLALSHAQTEETRLTYPALLSKLLNSKQLAGLVGKCLELSAALNSQEAAIDKAKEQLRICFGAP